MSTLCDQPSLAKRAGSVRPWALQALPPLPEIAIRLMSLMDEPETPLGEIVQLLRLDAALSAELLRVANSVLYNCSRRIDSVSHATVILGTDAVKRLALTVALNRFAERYFNHKMFRSCWSHSLAAAIVTEKLAEWSEQPPEQAYAAGLLHDIGRLALIACHLDEYEVLVGRAERSDQDGLAWEHRLFEVDHCAAGAWLAQQWNLPEGFVAAIAEHHSRDPNDFSLTSLVAAGERAATALGYGLNGAATHWDLRQALSGLPLPNADQVTKNCRRLISEIDTTLATVCPAA